VIPQSSLDLTALSVPRELEDSIFDFSRFQEVRHIGKGAQGSVNLWKDKTSDDLIAVKNVILSEWDIIDGRIRKRVLREVQSLMTFRHPCIVSLLGYDLQPGSKLLRIAMPYVGSASLKKVLKSPQNHKWFTSAAKTVIIVGIVIGMYFVHCGRIIHRDLKPANVLLDPISHYPKIADFGLSREANANPTERRYESLSKISMQISRKIKDEILYVLIGKWELHHCFPSQTPAGDNFALNQLQAWVNQSLSVHF
jgi:serine/threonine protein kinase